ncbi:hypothetical protein GCM10025869_32810 [Homoserinibacter gongjuensis]|uniref:Uncharacterized protein n=1 Tax=Homoserinibacter gongjuensis TaxID=1162968 RepID=A0ABQ6JYM5_9MICO|nr:hypothetical protein GCM10025869_32810 [Homoserinibacter gongjuensis]
MHEGSGVEELEGRGDRHDRGELAVGGCGVELGERALVRDRGDGAPAPVAEQRAEALAAREQLARLRDERRQIRRDLAERGRSGVERIVDSSGHEVD